MVSGVRAATHTRPMKIDLRHLEDHSGALSGEQLVRFEDAFGRENSARCRVVLSYQQTGGAYYFHGGVEGEFATSCHRCLQPVRPRIEGEFDVVVRRGETGDDALEPDELTEYVTLSAHQHELDFGPYVAEVVLVNLPMVVVCDADCKGLCPTCGVNWNETKCECRPTEDPRWDALRKLK